MLSDRVPEELDVAIVGGGVSGVYSAWRLRKEMSQVPELRQLADARPDRKLRVAVFEWSDRIGGRLFSKKLPGFKQVHVELGGMRFLSSHRRVSRLVEGFGLATRPLQVNDDKKTNLYYLRGQHFTAADWAQPSFSPPYRLERGERSRAPGELLIEVALKYEKQAHLMRDIGFWNLLLDEYSEEGLRMIREAGGYDTIVSNWSTAEALPFLLADFNPALKYFALNDGYQALPLKLAEAFRADGGTILGNRRLYRLDEENGQIRLTFDTDPDNFRCRQLAEKDGKIQAETYRARHVILAMPRRAIELLHPDSFIFRSRQFQEDLEAVLPQPALKIFAAYRKPWWQDHRNVRAGRSVTDLPIRQCYYWQTGGPPPEGQMSLEDPDNLNSILMASYDDGASQEFWAGLARHPERYDAPPNACPPGVPIPDPIRDLSASARMVAEMQDQLRELHGLSNVQDPKTAQIILPYVTVYQDWTQEPFGGGWHFWKLGRDARKVVRRMSQPLKEKPLYTCGEAWSRQQGWVEGALESADLVLERILGLPALPALEGEPPPASLADAVAAPESSAKQLWDFVRFR